MELRPLRIHIVTDNGDGELLETFAVEGVAGLTEIDLAREIIALLSKHFEVVED